MFQPIALKKTSRAWQLPCLKHFLLGQSVTENQYQSSILWRFAAKWKSCSEMILRWDLPGSFLRDLILVIFRNSHDFLAASCNEIFGVCLWRLFASQRRGNFDGFGEDVSTCCFIHIWTLEHLRILSSQHLTHFGKPKTLIKWGCFVWLFLLNIYSASPLSYVLPFTFEDTESVSVNTLHTTVDHITPYYIRIEQTLLTMQSKKICWSSFCWKKKHVLLVRKRT